MIRYLQGKEKNMCRALWKEAFQEDSASFTDYYFGHVVGRNRILADLEGEQVRSMIHMNPYELWVRGNLWRAEYLVGVATSEKCRRQGCMRRLLLRGMKDLCGERMPFCFLMPANEDIYKSFGFAYIAWKPRREPEGTAGLRRRSLFDEKFSDTNVINKPAIKAAGSEEYLEEVSEWLNRWLRSRYEIFALRSEEYLRRLAEEIASENGTLDVLYDGGAIVGLESIWGLEEREQRLLYGELPYVRELLPSEPAVMGRILNLREFVRVIRLRKNVETDNLVIPLTVTDEQLPENAGEWLWHLGRESSRLERPEGGKSGDRPSAVESGIPLRLGIEELAAWMFGWRIPEAAELYAESVDTIQGVLLDEVV